MSELESIPLRKDELAEYLMKNGFLGQREIEDVRAYMERTNKYFEEAAIERGHLSPDTVKTVSLYLKLRTFMDQVKLGASIPLTGPYKVDKN